MSRRRMLSSVHRAIARHSEPVQVGADHSTVARMSIADLDRIGPRLVTTLPAERAICIYCCGAPATDAHFPYCSAQCAISAENS